MTQIYIISGTSWTVPADWNAGTNSIETLGAGGGGQTADPSYAGSGGGGGAYSQITNLSLQGGVSIALQVGSGGAAGSTGGDTWFNGASLSASSVGAKGGAAGTDLTGGAGGNASNGIGTTRFSGGDGASPGPNPWTGGGGGEAAGPNGAGGTGGSPNNSTIAGAGGGGGNGGGSAGSDGDISTGSGGAGGNGNGGTGAGAGDNGSGAGNGATATGSGGGGGKYLTSDNGGDGATGREFDSSHGSGGGGGGGGGRNGAAAGNGGKGVSYGGGGGGGGYPASGTAWGTGGAGGDGIIVVTYTSANTTAITAKSGARLEFVTAERSDATTSLEAGSGILGSGAVAAEWRALRRSSSRAASECLATTRGDSELLFEWSIRIASDSKFTLEPLQGVTRDASVPDETLPVLSPEALATSEWGASGARVSAAGLLNLEWADPPALVLVSPGRLLRSAGKVRVLSAPGSIHPLRGQ